jgi:hypothetical protein
MSILDIIAVLALILSIINFYLLQRQYKQTTMPAIKYDMRELSPYSTKHDLTMTRVRIYAVNGYVTPICALLERGQTLTI